MPGAPLFCRSNYYADDDALDPRRAEHLERELGRLAAAGGSGALPSYHPHPAAERRVGGGGGGVRASREDVENLERQLQALQNSIRGLSDPQVRRGLAAPGVLLAPTLRWEPRAREGFLQSFLVG